MEGKVKYWDPKQFHSFVSINEMQILGRNITFSDENHGWYNQELFLHKQMFELSSTPSEVWRLNAPYVGDLV